NAVLTETPQDLGEYDYLVPVMSLAYRLGFMTEQLARAGRYIAAPAEGRQAWVQRLDSYAAGRFRVGLVWRGSPDHRNDRFRSAALSCFAPFARTDVCFVSLQAGASVEQTPEGMDMLMIGDQLHDFADTAQVIEHLDLVIGVDTSV